ncbi:flagellar motor protein MotB [Roseiterribacter gracilis]|uniref:Chemotaxis protein MotB n=1 Tax=Roseiterribacter gracilis TaxID=2812848 RepID=A0A8S8XAJ3_9PROT|nr:chemotaxis protein MotB [Rhodospirillales bacterium TMPK1]
MAEKGAGASIIIKKHGDDHEHGHHGGAWKVAYADFVTAMMAFFLLLWLLNATSEEQKKGIADYFDPNVSASSSRSGSGGVLGGTTLAPKGAMTSDSSNFELKRNERLAPVEEADTVSQETKIETEAKAAAEQARKEEEERFKSVEKALKETLEKQPELKNLAQNLLIDSTAEGLRIQLIDQQNYSMFERGSAYMTPEARRLVAQIVQVVNQLNNKLSIRGHTDSRPFVSRAGYDNWNLSSDRALDTRLALLEGGLDPRRISNVTGLADGEPLVPDPLDARNRRMSIILLREAKGVPGK